MIRNKDWLDFQFEFLDLSEYVPSLGTEVKESKRLLQEERTDIPALFWKKCAD